MSSEESLLFIVGCERSGTTLLRTILHCHPEVSVGYEFAFYKRLADRFLGYPDIASAVDDFLDDLVSLRRFDTWRLDRESIRRRLQESPPVSFPQAVMRICQEYRDVHKPGATYLGIKNPSGVGHIPFILELFPAARVIVMVRDVRGILASQKKKKLEKDNFHPGHQVLNAALSYKSMLRTLHRYRHDTRVYPIPYEQLIQSLEATSRGLCEWLGIEFSNDMLRYDELNRALGLVPENELWQHGKTLYPPDATRIDAWKRELSEKELIAVEALCRRELVGSAAEPLTKRTASLKALPLLASGLTQLWRTRKRR